VIPVHIHIENKSRYPVDEMIISVDDMTKLFKDDVFYKFNSKGLSHRKLYPRIQPGDVYDDIVFQRLPACAPSFSASVPRRMVKEITLQVNLSIPHAHCAYVSLPIVVGSVPHAQLPLFRELETSQASIPCFSWANVDQITKMAASGQGSSGPESTKCEKGEIPTDLTYFRYDIKYVFFEMPQPRSSDSETPGAPKKITVPYFTPDMPPVFFAPLGCKELSPSD